KPILPVQPIPSFLPSQSQVVPEPHAAHAERDLPDDVPERGFMISAVAEREGVEAEAGKRREAAEDADEDKRPRKHAEMQSPAGYASGEEANHQTPNYVDNKHRPRHRPLEPMRDFETHQVARH